MSEKLSLGEHGHAVFSFTYSDGFYLRGHNLAFSPDVQKVPKSSLFYSPTIRALGLAKRLCFETFNYRTFMTPVVPVEISIEITEIYGLVLIVWLTVN